MKNNVKIILLVILTIIFTSGLFMKLKDCFSSKMLMENEVIEMFINNKERFIGVSEQLIKFDYHWTIRKEKYNEKLRQDWKSVVLKGGIQLVIQEQDHFSDILYMKNIAENNEDINYIMNKLDFKIITSNSKVDSECIYFVKQTSVGLESGLIYSTDHPQNKYITQITPISDNWFYYESK